MSIFTDGLSTRPTFYGTGWRQQLSTSTLVNERVNTNWHRSLRLGKWSPPPSGLSRRLRPAFKNKNTHKRGLRHSNNISRGKRTLQEKFSACQNRAKGCPCRRSTCTKDFLSCRKRRQQRHRRLGDEKARISLPSTAAGGQTLIKKVFMNLIAAGFIIPGDVLMVGNAFRVLCAAGWPWLRSE